MAENEIGEYLEIDANNVDIAGISVQENVMRPPAVNNAFRALQGALKRWFRTDLFRLRDSTDQTKLAAFDLSGIPTGTTRTYTFPATSGSISLSGVDTRRNRIVNGDKLVSQENGQTAGTTNGRYLSDQNAMYFVSSAGVFTGVNVQTLSPAGGYRDRITITTADAALAAGEYLTYTQNIEGSSVRDLKWGMASASAIVVRFGFKGPAGTYAMALHNNGVARSYVALFTISAGQANTDTLQTFAVPGDVSGTWLSADGVIGMTIDVVLAAGSTFQGAAGWQAGNILGTSGVSNGLATAGAVFEFFDFGLRADPNATGVYGAYEVGVTDAVYRSERYWSIISGAFTGFAYSSTTGTMSVPILVGFCKIPTMLNGGNGTWFDGASSGTVSNAVLGAGYRGASSAVDFSTTGMTAFRPVLINGQTLVFRARLS